LIICAFQIELGPFLLPCPLLLFEQFGHELHYGQQTEAYHRDCHPNYQNFQPKDHLHYQTAVDHTSNLDWLVELVQVQLSN
jgi:hypothetical protein